MWWNLRPSRAAGKWAPVGWNHILAWPSRWRMRSACSMCDRFGYQCAACNISMHMSLNHLRMLLLNIPVIEIHRVSIGKHQHQPLGLWGASAWSRTPSGASRTPSGVWILPIFPWRNPQSMVQNSEKTMEKGYETKSKPRVRHWQSSSNREVNHWTFHWLWLPKLWSVNGWEIPELNGS